MNEREILIAEFEETMEFLDLLWQESVWRDTIKGAYDAPTYFEYYEEKTNVKNS